MKISDTQKYTFDPKTTVYSCDLKPLPKPLYCGYDNCRCIIPHGGSYEVCIIKGKKIKFCDEWCKEQACLKNNHPCKYCGVETEPIRINGFIRAYRKICDDCKKEKQQERIKKKEGHICKNCGEYRLLNLFRPSTSVHKYNKCNICFQDDNNIKHQNKVYAKKRI